MTTSPSSTSDTELGSSTEERADSGSSTGEPFSVCPSFIDDFEDGREDPVWLQAPNSASEEVDGEWKILVSAAGEDEFARMLIPLPGGFEDGTARFEIGTPPNDDNVLLILWLQQDGGEGRVAFNLIQLGALLELQARVTSEAGPPGLVVDSAPWDMVADRWMQLREDAGMLHFETSPDGVAFSPVFSITTPISLENVSVGIVGHNRDDLPTDVEVSVRNFELSCVD